MPCSRPTLVCTTAEVGKIGVRRWPLLALLAAFSACTDESESASRTDASAPLDAAVLFEQDARAAPRSDSGADAREAASGDRQVDAGASADAQLADMAECSGIGQSYATTLSASRRCRLDTTEQQCASSVRVQLGCSSCTTFITTSTAVAQLAHMWAARGCDRFTWECPISTDCRMPAAASCILDSAEGPLGSCHQSP